MIQKPGGHFTLFKKRAQTRPPTGLRIGLDYRAQVIYYKLSVSRFRRSRLVRALRSLYRIPRRRHETRNYDCR
jgi:hypothetical protein